MIVKKYTDRPKPAPEADPGTVDQGEPTAGPPPILSALKKFAADVTSALNQDQRRLAAAQAEAARIEAELEALRERRRWILSEIALGEKDVSECQDKLARLDAEYGNFQIRHRSGCDFPQNCYQEVAWRQWHVARLAPILKQRKTDLQALDDEILKFELHHGLRPADSPATP